MSNQIANDTLPLIDDAARSTSTGGTWQDLTDKIDLDAATSSGAGD